jgi:hypothetical protein
MSRIESRTSGTIAKNSALDHRGGRINYAQANKLKGNIDVILLGKLRFERVFFSVGSLVPL